MSLDAKTTTLTKQGVITISERGISVDGFEGDNATCRDIVVLACLWGIQRLAVEAFESTEKPGGGSASIDALTGLSYPNWIQPVQPARD